MTTLKGQPELEPGRAQVVADEKAAEARYQKEVPQTVVGGKEAPTADNPYPIQQEVVIGVDPIWPQDGAVVPQAGAKAGAREVSGPEAAYMAAFDETRRLLKEMRKDPLLSEADRVAAAEMNEVMREAEEGRLKALTHPHFEVRQVIWGWLGVKGKV